MTADTTAISLDVYEGIAYHRDIPSEFCYRKESWKDDRTPFVVAQEPLAESENITLEKEFNRLAQDWKSGLGPQSSITRIVTHPAYLEIISHGEEMIPFVLRELQREPNHWFIALKAMAKNFSPVRPEDAGNIKKMAEAWLEWGRKNGKLP